MKNVAKDPDYSGIKSQLNGMLLNILREQNDPRVVETPCRFEYTPYAGKLQDFQK